MFDVQNELIARLRLICAISESEEIEGTFMIEAEQFTLSCCFDDASFEIRNIETFERGTGKKVLHAIHACCDAAGLSVCASNVRDTATGFWSKMGYAEGSVPGEYFKIT